MTLFTYKLLLHDPKWLCRNQSTVGPTKFTSTLLSWGFSGLPNSEQSPQRPRLRAVLNAMAMLLLCRVYALRRLIIPIKDGLIPMALFN